MALPPEENFLDANDSDDSQDFLDAVYNDVRAMEEEGKGRRFDPNKSVEEMEREMREAAEDFEKNKQEEGEIKTEEGEGLEEKEETKEDVDHELEARKKREEAMTEEEKKVELHHCYNT